MFAISNMDLLKKTVFTAPSQYEVNQIDMRHSIACFISVKIYSTTVCSFMSHTHFRANLHSLVTWMSRNSLLKTSAIFEV